MVRFFRCFDNGSLSKRLLLGKRRSAGLEIRAHISTNTAINKSLRRTSLEGNRGRRPPPRREKFQYGRLPRDSSFAPQRVPRPNHQQGLDSRDNERYNALKPGRSTRRAPRTLAQEAISDRSDTQGTIRRARAQYDYSRKPGGNRATRRAAQYGQPKDLSSEPQAAAFDRRASNRRAAVEDTNDEESNGYSERPSPLEESENNYREPSTLPKRSFTIGRHSPQEERGQISRSPQDYDQATTSRHPQAPLSIPYTTPASEFLYGTSVVIAALLSSRRKLYKLYIYDGENREARDQDIRIRRMAVERGVVAQKVAGDWLRLMDKMSTGRPHNVRLFAVALDTMLFS